MDWLPPEAREEWRRHWRVVVGCGLGMATCYSVFPFVASLFVEPVQQTFGWSRGQQALSHNANLIAACLAPLIGAAIDRLGVRRVLLPAIMAVVCVYVFLANMTASIAHYYAGMAALALLGIATTGLAFTRAVTSWFEASRGLALAASRLGLAVAGALLPIAVFAMIERFGFAGGFYLLAGVTLLIGLPVSWAFVRDRRVEGAARRSAFGDWRLWPTLLGNRRVLLLCLAAGLTYGPAVGLLSQLKPLLVDKAIDPAAAAGLVSLLALSTFLGTAITGAIVDRVWAPALGFGFTIGPVIGCLLLYFLPEPGVGIAAVSIVLLGLAQGAEIDLIGFMIARYFGMRAFASIYGLTVMATGLCSAVGAIAIGQMYDLTGGYDQALLLAASCFLVAAAAYPLLGRYPAEPGYEPSANAPSPTATSLQPQER